MAKFMTINVQVQVAEERTFEIVRSASVPSWSMRGRKCIKCKWEISENHGSTAVVAETASGSLLNLHEKCFNDNQ